MKKTTVSGIRGERLARLLAIGKADAEDEKLLSLKTKSELLRSGLSAPFPPDGAAVDSLSRAVGRLREKLQPLSDRTLGEILLDANTGVEVFRAIKGFFKERAQNGSHEELRAVAGAVYYAAIAGALVTCNEKISSFSCADLDRGLARLMDRDWIPPELKDLFRKAQALVRSDPGT